MRDNGTLSFAREGTALRLEPHAIQAFQALFIGFTFAGLVASAFELFTARKASFHLLQLGGVKALASVPVVVFAAPFLIIRNTVRGRAIEGRPFHFVMLATIIAGFWSLMCGQVVMNLWRGSIGI
jgi:hypothetical protein